MTEQLNPESSPSVTFSKELLREVTTTPAYDLLTPQQQQSLREYTTATIKARQGSLDQAEVEPIF